MYMVNSGPYLAKCNILGFTVPAACVRLSLPIVHLLIQSIIKPLGTYVNLPLRGLFRGMGGVGALMTAQLPYSFQYTRSAPVQELGCTSVYFSCCPACIPAFFKAKYSKYPPFRVMSHIVDVKHIVDDIPFCYPLQRL